MSATLTNLEDILRQLTELHRRLLEAADATRTAIIEGDVDAMETVLAEEQRLIRDVEAAEAVREELVKEARKELGVRAATVRMQDIVDAAPDEAAETLGAARDALREVLDRLQYRTRQNRELLAASMSHVDAFLQTVREACNPGASTYTPEGRRAGGGLRLLDRSA